MIGDDTNHPPRKKKYMAVRGHERTVGGKKVKVRAHLKRKKSFWDVFEKTPKFNPAICGKEEERTTVF